MEEKQVIKRLVKKPDTSSSGNSLMKVLNVVMFVMIFVIFVRGFNVKSTVRSESELTQTIIKEYIDENMKIINMNREVDKNATLSAFALYSRLDATELKNKEDYHKSEQEKYQNLANQLNNSLKLYNKKLQGRKDTIK